MLPGGPFEFHGLSGPQAAAGVPLGDAQADALLVTSPVILVVFAADDGEQHTPSVGRHPVHVRGDGNREPAGELLRLEEAVVLRGQPGLGQRQH